MSISEIISYDKEGKPEGRLFWLRRFFLSTIIILVATLSFGIGRLSVTGDREPIRIEYDPSISSNSNIETLNSKQITDSNIQTNQAASVIQAISGQSVVASKNGSKYHYQHCAGAKQIKEENKIVFRTPAVAEAAGYTLAANCKSR